MRGQSNGVKLYASACVMISLSRCVRVCLCVRISTRFEACCCGNRHREPCTDRKTDTQTDSDCVKEVCTGLTALHSWRQPNRNYDYARQHTWCLRSARPALSRRERAGCPSSPPCGKSAARRKTTDRREQNDRDWLDKVF